MTSKPAETDIFVPGTSKPVESKWRGFLNFLYNSKEGTVLGRTGKSWLQITVFYIIFYGVLAAFFAVLLVLFLQTLDPKEPKWQQANGIIGSVPGMGFRPIPKDSGSTLIWVKTAKQDNTVQKPVQAYIDGLKQFLEPYEPGNQTTDNFKQCSDGDFDPSKPRDDTKTCKFNILELDRCNKENNFGYTHGQPCVLLKLNKIFNWVPDTYASPDQMKEELVDFITRVQKQTPASVFKPNQIYVTCDGEDAVDKEHIGPVKLYPSTIPKFYFPYRNSPGYLSPIVMVEFQNPDPGVVINVECKAWANNIEYSRTDRLGMVHFEILVDR